jgi:hypothetical protein
MSSRRVLGRRPLVGLLAALIASSALGAALAPVVLGDGLVQISGTVTYADGTPAVGDAVYGLGAGSLVDADGHFLFHVLPNQPYGRLTFGPTPATIAVEGVDIQQASTDPFNVGTTDLTIDFVWPAPASIVVTVEDATGQALPGVGVTGSRGGNVSQTVSAGIHASVGFQVPNNVSVSCSTDSNGQCSFLSLAGANFYAYSDYYQLVPGDGSYPTLLADGYLYGVVGGSNQLLLRRLGPDQVTTIAISGTVTYADGTPAVGDAVYGLGAGSLVDADGHFLFHVLPNQPYGRLTFGPTPATIAVEGVDIQQASTDPFNVGTTDLTIDFVWPAPASIVVTVEDATGQALPGVGVTGSRGGNVSQTVSAGIHASVGFQVPNNVSVSCSTDSNGQCSFLSLAGANFYAYSDYYQLVPGDGSYPTLLADGYLYGVVGGSNQLLLRFVSLASFTSSGTVAGSVTAAAPSGCFSDISNANIGDTLPSGAVVLTGALTYQVACLTVGGSIDVSLRLPDGSAPTGVFKFQNGQYVDVSSIATINGDIVTLHLVDGGLGDADGVADGTIIDPVIPVQLQGPGTPAIGQAGAGNASASVAFTAPAGNGGSPILDYTATCTSTNGGVMGSATGAGSPLSVTGLSNNKTYTCSVAARNIVGSSLASAASNAVIPPGKPAAILTYTGATSAKPGASITLTATIKTGSGSPISGRKVSFLLNGTTYTATSNSSGLASKDAKAPTTPGIYPITVSFDGDATYASAATTASLADRQATSISYGGPTTAIAGSSITFSATLKTSSGTALPGRTVTFTLNGTAYTGVTNASGAATASAAAPATTGSFPIGITFAGDSTAAPSSASASLKVTIGSALTYTGATTAHRGKSVVLSARLLAASGSPISGRTVKFTFNGKSYSATTDATGNAIVTVMAPSKAGTYPVAVTFVGDTTFAAASTSAALTVT